MTLETLIRCERMVSVSYSYSDGLGRSGRGYHGFVGTLTQPWWVRSGGDNHGSVRRVPNSNLGTLDDDDSVDRGWTCTVGTRTFDRVSQTVSVTLVVVLEELSVSKQSDDDNGSWYVTKDGSSDFLTDRRVDGDYDGRDLFEVLRILIQVDLDDCGHCRMRWDFGFQSVYVE